MSIFTRKKKVPKGGPQVTIAPGQTQVKQTTSQVSGMPRGGARPTPASQRQTATKVGRPLPTAGGAVAVRQEGAMQPQPAGFMSNPQLKQVFGKRLVIMQQNLTEERERQINKGKEEIGARGRGPGIIEWEKGLPSGSSTMRGGTREEWQRAEEKANRIAQIPNINIALVEVWKIPDVRERQRVMELLKERIKEA